MSVNLVDPRVGIAAQPWVALALVIGAVVSAALAVFVGGEILSDPGGVQGLAWVVAWLVPPLALSALALRWTDATYPVLVAVVALVCVASVGGVVWAQALWEFEDAHGPVNLLVLVAVLIPLIALGRSLPWEAGWLMAIALSVPLALQAVSLGRVGEWSVIPVLVVVAAPYAVVAALLVVGGRRARPPESVTSSRV